MKDLTYTNVVLTVIMFAVLIIAFNSIPRVEAFKNIQDVNILQINGSYIRGYKIPVVG